MYIKALELVRLNKKIIFGIVNQIEGYPHGFSEAEVEKIIGFNMDDMSVLAEKVLHDQITVLLKRDFDLIMNILEFSLITIDSWESPALIDIRKSELIDIYKSFLILEEEEVFG